VARSLQFAAFVVAGVGLAQAADLAVLRNGNSIRHERRQVVGAVTRLYLSDTASGYIEIPTNEIQRFEVDTAPPPLKPQVPPAVRVPQFQQAVAVMPKTAVRPQAVVTQRGVTQPVVSQPVLDRASLGKLVNGAGERHQIDPDFINSVIRAESGFNSRAVSKKGAQGLMQLMPQTASQLGVTNSLDPNANIEGGTKYLRELLEKYNFDVAKALAAYNAGPRRVEQYKGVPPYYETRAYIARIIRDFNRQKLAENPSLGLKQAKGPQHRSTNAPSNASAARPPQAGTRASR
jgi:hypothetical protein